MDPSVADCRGPDGVPDPFKFHIPRLARVLKFRAEFDRVAIAGDAEAERCEGAPRLQIAPGAPQSELSSALEMFRCRRTARGAG